MKRGKKELTTEQINIIKEVYAECKSYILTAQKTGFNHMTVRKYTGYKPKTKHNTENIQPRINDLTGKKFGLLEVLGLAEEEKLYGGVHITTWKCKCKCGEIINVVSNSLVNGKTSSCGRCHLYDTNTSGVRGVYFAKNYGKWKAAIVVNYKNYHLGTYETKESAILARKEAEKHLDDDFEEWYMRNYK